MISEKYDEIIKSRISLNLITLQNTLEAFITCSRSRKIGPVSAKHFLLSRFWGKPIKTWMFRKIIEPKINKISPRV